MRDARIDFVAEDGTRFRGVDWKAENRAVLHWHLRPNNIISSRDSHSSPGMLRLTYGEPNDHVHCKWNHFPFN